MAGYIGILGNTSNTQTLTNLIASYSSLYGAYTDWTSYTSNYTYSQKTGYVQATNKTASSAWSRVLLRAFSSTVSGSTEATNQKIYVRADLRGYSTNSAKPTLGVERYVNGATSLNTSYLTGGVNNDGNWYIKSYIWNTYENGTYYEYKNFVMGFYSPVVGDKMDMRNVIVVNLTAMFGRGNEPTKTWCDEHIAMDNPNNLATPPVTYTVTNEIPLTNLVNNVNFVNSKSGWSTGTTSYFSYTQGVGYQTATVTSTRSSTTFRPLFYQNFANSLTTDTNKIVYARMDVRGNTSNTQQAKMMFRQYKDGSTSITYFTNLVQNTGDWVSSKLRLNTIASDGKREYIGLGLGISEPFTTGDTFDVKNIFAVNLTEEFGAGSEPSLAWCDENITLRGNVPVYPADSRLPELARTISKIYIGVNGVAKKIKRGYIGVNGIARRWFGLPDFYALLNWGTTSDTLAAGKYGMASGSVGDTAIFAGGITNLLNTVTSTMTFNNAVDAYNSSLVHSTLPNMPYQIGNAGAAVLGNQMLIMGGINTASNGGLLGAQKTTTTVMDYGWYYNAGLISTGVFAGANLSVARGALKGDTIGNYALFAGGNLACDGTTTASFSNAVEAFSSATVKVTSPSNLANAASKLASCHSDNYVIFAGGIHSGVDPQGYVNSESSINGINNVTAYSTSLVRTYPSNLTYVDCYPSATSVGNYLLVATRNTTTDATTGTINVYNGSTLSKLTSLTLPKNKNNMMSATVNGCAYFFGGWLTQQGYSSGAFSNTVDGYTSELVHFITSNLSTPRIESCVATTGDYTLLAGGKSSGSLMMSVLSNVETYKLAKTPVVGITSGGGTTTSQSYYSAYIKVGDTNYTSIGNITVNAGESLTICAKAATGSYTSGNTTYYYNANVVIRVNGTTVYTVQYNGSYTSSYYNYSLGTVSEDTAYSVSLVYGYQTHTGTSPNTYYVDVYTIPGMLKESVPTPTPTPTNLIAFTVQVYANRSGTSTYWNYVAESGMTWTQFISSTYNAGDFYTISSSYAGYYAPSSWGTSGVYLKTASGGSNVALTATIIADHVYYCSVSE